MTVKTHSDAMRCHALCLLRCSGWFVDGYLLVQVKWKLIPTNTVFIPQTLVCCASYQEAAPVRLFRYSAAVSASQLQGQSESNLFVLSHNMTSALGESLVTTLARAARFAPANASWGTPFTCSKLICSHLLMCSAYWHQTDHAECVEHLIRVVNKAHNKVSCTLCAEMPL